MKLAHIRYHILESGVHISTDPFHLLDQILYLFTKSIISVLTLYQVGVNIIGYIQEIICKK